MRLRSTIALGCISGPIATIIYSRINLSTLLSAIWETLLVQLRIELRDVQAVRVVRLVLVPCGLRPSAGSAKTTSIIPIMGPHVIVEVVLAGEHRRPLGARCVRALVHSRLLNRPVQRN